MLTEPHRFTLRRKVAAFVFYLVKHLINAIDEEMFKYYFSSLIYAIFVMYAFGATENVATFSDDFYSDDFYANIPTARPTSWYIPQDPTQRPTSHSKPDLSDGAIAGIVIAVLVGSGIVVLVLASLYSRYFGDELTSGTKGNNVISWGESDPVEKEEYTRV